MFYFLFISYPSKKRPFLYAIFFIFFIITMNSKLTAFLFGIILCDLYKNSNLSIPSYFYSTLASFGWLFSNFFYNILDNTALHKLHDIKSLYPIILGSFIIYGSLKSHFISNILESRIFVYFGKISFSMYLLHLPIFSSFSCILLGQILDCGAKYPAANDTTLFLSLLVLIFTSHLFCKYIDQGAINLSHKIESYFTK